MYAIGAILSSTLLGAVLGSLGSVLISPQWRLLALVSVALVGIGMAACDFGIAGMRTPTLSRQTCPIWWRTFRRSLAAFLWGLDLGLGFTTIRVASLYWIVALMAVVLASPFTGALILSGYGLALTLNLSVGIWLLEHKDDHLHSANMHALQSFSFLKRSLGGLLFFWSSILLIIVALRK